jgi:glutaredoxin-like protein NrdH
LKVVGIGVILSDKDRERFLSTPDDIRQTRHTTQGVKMRNVFIYALSTCSHCKRTKKFLEENNIPFDFVDVDLCQGEERQQTINDVKKHNPKTTFPTVLIDENVIVGYKEDELKKALGLE